MRRRPKPTGARPPLPEELQGFNPQTWARPGEGPVEDSVDAWFAFTILMRHRREEAKAAWGAAHGYTRNEVLYGRNGANFDLFRDRHDRRSAP